MAIPKKELDLELSKLQWELDRALRPVEKGYDSINVETFCDDIFRFAEEFADFKARATRPGKRQTTKQVQSSLPLETLSPPTNVVEEMKNAEAQKHEPAQEQEDVQQDSRQDTQIQRKRKAATRRN